MGPRSGIETGSACLVTYRGTVADGSEREIRLRIAAEMATMADAWARLSARYGTVDPRSMEIEIREADWPNGGGREIYRGYRGFDARLHLAEV
jgi:hypothetical protein